MPTSSGHKVDGQEACFFSKTYVMPTNLMPTNYSLTTNWHHVVATNRYGYREFGGQKDNFSEKTNVMPTNFIRDL